MAIGEVILADGKLIILTEKGELIPAKASAEKWDLLFRGQFLGADTVRHLHFAAAFSTPGTKIG